MRTLIIAGLLLAFAPGYVARQSSACMAVEAAYDEARTYDIPAIDPRYAEQRNMRPILQMVDDAERLAHPGAWLWKNAGCAVTWWRYVLSPPAPIER
jgi:hypothetical protein